MNFANVNGIMIPVNGVQKEVASITDSMNRVIWQIPSVDPEPNEYFYMKNITQNTTFNLAVTASASADNVTLYYSTDKTSWTSKYVGSQSSGEKVTDITTISPGTTLYLKATTTQWGHRKNPSYGSYVNTYKTFTFTGNSANTPGIILGGNTLSLIYGDNFQGKTGFASSAVTYGFYRLFRGCVPVTDAARLWLPQYSYERGLSMMFYSCAYLKNPPQNIGYLYVGNCASMFYGCSSLVKSPIIHAAGSMPNYACQSMFYGCSVLSDIVCDTGAPTGTDCVTNWVEGVAASGTFHKRANISWGTGTSGIPSGWTVVNV